MKSERITVSTPGKLMVFGEHAVVYGRPCIVTAVDQRMRVKVEPVSGKKMLVVAPEVKVMNYEFEPGAVKLSGVPKGVKFIVAAASNFKELFASMSGLKITTASEFSSQFGFGSSSAVTVGVLKAMAEIFGVKMDNRRLFEVAYKSVLDVQGVGSGFDLAAAIWGGTLYFITGGKKITPLRIKDLPVVVGYTGIKADTTTWVKFVSERLKEHPQLIENLFNTIAIIVEEASIRLQEGRFQEAGELMDINQGLLEALGVSTIELSRLIYAARQSGAWGAKLSGAGGGDCMISLVNARDKKAVEEAIEQAGGTVIHVQTNAPGVKVE